MKIGSKILLIIVLITFLLGLTALSGVFLSSNLLEQQIKEKYLAVSTYAMEKVHRLFSRRAEEMEALANEPVLRSRKSTPRQISQLLKSYKDHHISSYAPFASLAFYDSDRICLAETEGQGVGTRQDLSGFWRQIGNGDDFALDYTVSATIAGDYFDLARLVRDNKGIPLGVVVAKIPVGALQNLAKRPLKLFAMGMSLDMNLVNRDGLIIYSTHNKEGILKENWAKFGAVQAAIAAGEQNGTTIYSETSQDKPDEILIFAHETGDENYRGNDWTLIITVPEHLALSAIIGLRNRMAWIIAVIAGLCAGIAIILSQSITRPIAMLSEAASAVGEGRLDIVVNIPAGGEVGNLAEKFNCMVQKLGELNQELQIAASIDKLTGALNRREIEKIMQLELQRSMRHCHPFSLILIDLDHFKQVNDTHGHLIGDLVLKSVVAVIKQNIRMTDSLSRWGGEEFLLLLPETNISQACEVAEKVRKSVELCSLAGVGRITISCGVAEMRLADSEDSLIKRADDALYAAKRRGRNLVETERAALQTSSGQGQAGEILRGRIRS